MKNALLTVWRVVVSLGAAVVVTCAAAVLGVGVLALVLMLTPH